jgi:DNA repair photolyase
MVLETHAKSILNRHKRRDPWFLDDYSINPYSACAFNCAYCYVRGSKYGVNMAAALTAKTNAPEVLDKQLALRARKGDHGIVVVSSATDPSLPIEEHYRLTRRCLEVLLKHRFPVRVITRSPLVLRDLDLLQQIDRTAILPPDLHATLARGAVVSFSFTSLRAEVVRAFEPSNPSPQERLQAMRACKDADLLVGLNNIPALPFLCDSDAHLEEIISAAKDHGAHHVLVGGLTLFGAGPADSRTLYLSALRRHFPHLVAPTQNLYRSGSSPDPAYEADLESRARTLCHKHGLLSRTVE